MKKFLLKILILTLVPLFVFAAPDKTQERIEYEVFKAKTELELKAIAQEKSATSKEVSDAIQQQNNKLESFNQRISDINLYLAIYAILGTILGIGVAIVSLWTANARVKNTAEEWFKANESGLLDRINELKTQLEQHTEKAKEEITKNQDDFKLWQNSKSSPTEKESVKQTDASLKDKPESQYSASDWLARARHAYNKESYALAADYCLKVVEANPTEEQAVTALFNRAYVLGVHFNQPEAEITTYDSLIQKFGDSQHAEVQAQVAGAYVNKGATQGDKLNQPEAAITTYDSLIQKFGDSQHAEVQVQVARAYNGLGFANLIKAKQNWKTKAKRDALLSQAIEYFTKAVAKYNANDKGIILGNIAYADWLLGNKTNAEQQLKVALEMGGEELYKGTVSDTEKITVPLDKSFRVLLEKVWAEVSKK